MTYTIFNARGGKDLKGVPASELFNHLPPQSKFVSGNRFNKKENKLIVQAIYQGPSGETRIIQEEDVKK